MKGINMENRKPVLQHPFEYARRGRGEELAIIGGLYLAIGVGMYVWVAVTFGLLAPMLGWD